MDKDLATAIHDDALLAHDTARNSFGRLYAASKGLQLLEEGGYRGPWVDQLAQLVIDARAEG